MKLTKEQQEQLVTQLNKIWGNKICEVCGQSRWMIDDTLFELREFHGGRTIIGSGAIKPVITLSCNSCGNTKFMNAILIGLVDPNKPVENRDEGGKHE